MGGVDRETLRDFHMDMHNEGGRGLSVTGGGGLNFFLSLSFLHFYYFL